VYSSSQTASPLREVMCYTGSHSVTCHPAEVTFPPLPQPIKYISLNSPTNFILAMNNTGISNNYSQLRGRKIIRDWDPCRNSWLGLSTLVTC